MPSIYRSTSTLRAIERASGENLQRMFCRDRTYVNVPGMGGLFCVDVKLDRLQDAYDKAEQRAEELDRAEVFFRDGHYERL